MKIMKIINIKTLFLFVSLGISTLTFASPPPVDVPATPVVAIEGADEIVPFGEMVQLSVKKDKEPPDAFFTKYDWQIFDSNQVKKRVYISPNGETVLFAAGIKPTKFLAVLDATYTYIVKDDKGIITDVKTYTTGIVSAEIKVGGNDPPQPPDPGPGPNPPPAPKPFPESPLGLVKPSVDAVNEMKNPKKTEVARELAKVYANISGRVAGQEFSTLKDTYTKLQDEIDEVFTKTGADKTEWQIWDNKVRKIVYTLYLDKKLPQLTDYIGVFTEISESLDYVAEQK